MKTSRFVAMTAAAILVASAAQADPSEFAGFYAGAHVGYTSAKADVAGGNMEDDALMGGFQAGYNWHSGNIIWGLETDISLTGAHPQGTCPFNSGAHCSVDPVMFSTLRARAGYATGNWLFYLTGGAAAGRFDVESNSLAGQTHDHEGALGWTGGVGVEYLLGGGMPGPRNVGLKLEYRYIDLSNDLISQADFDSGPNNASKHNIDFTSHTVMVGLNWHF